MTGPIDFAYVELQAHGEKDVARDIKKMIADIQRNVDKLSKEVEKSFTEAGRDIERELTEAGSTLTKEAVRQRQIWKEVSNSLSLDMKAGATAAKSSIDDFADQATRDLRRVTNAALATSAAVASAGSSRNTSRNVDLNRNRGPHTGDAGIVGRVSNAIGDMGRLLSNVMGRVRDLARELTDTLGDAVSKAAQGLSAIGGTISSILGPIGAFISSLGMLGVALALAPFIIPLIAALAQLSGLLLLLPGAIGILIAAIAPLIMAFSGLGDAVSALASGDLNKIEEAMKNLSPAAQRFAREINALREPLKQLKLLVQEKFFSQFQGELTRLVNAALPTLRAGLGTVSSSLGRFTGMIMDLLGSQDILEAIGDVFASTGRIIDRIAPSFTRALGVIIGAIEHSMPFIERMFGALGDGMDKFSSWLSNAMKTGDFERWLENAFKIANDLWELFKALGELLGAVFGGLGDEGDSMLQSITKMVKKLTEFFKSPEGKKFMEDLANGALAVANAIVVLSGAITDIGKFIARVDQKVKAFSAAVRGAGDAIGSFFSGMWDSAKGLGESVSGFFQDAGNWVKELGSAVSERGGKIIAWFQELPDKVTNALSELPGKVSDFFREMFDNVFYAVGYGLGTIVQFFIDLPSRVVGALSSLWTTIQTWFTSIYTTMSTSVLSAVNAVVQFFTDLPGRVVAAVTSLIDRVREIFNQTRTRVVDTTSSLVNSVVSFFQRMPGRVMDAIRSLPGRILDLLRGIVRGAANIGGDIMDGIARGIRNGWNSAINAAREAAHQVLKGFWDALDIGSPSKVSAATVGVPIMQGVGVGVIQEIPTLRSMINNAIGQVIPTATNNSQAITFGPGAVQVNFDGSAPTQQEAMQTGLTVGRGVAQTLARRNIRTSIRTQ